MKFEKGILYVVATPIGNWQDITLRALDVLKKADLIVCEELRVGSTLLRRMDIRDKELFSLNEHNEQEEAPNLIARLAKGEVIALISDSGTPVFADPGHYLIEQAAIFGMDIIPIPGVSSLMATLSILDFHLEQFYFAGFLPREKTERQRALNSLRSMNVPIVLMDTPYRLVKLLDEIGHLFGKNRRITLATNITMENEKYYRGSIAEVSREIQQKKAEFILVVHGR
ncbi:MAG: 16S rRNA (cytidine(1402)-2'-O)-methyltransferase [Chloroflexi bacterium 44-23]|nr:MAG: 16S rRNA (cytidine(1402)-2'-O)-methyltransferase [Chloroflexi bacterium 44-23]